MVSRRPSSIASRSGPLRALDLASTAAAYSMAWLETVSHHKGAYMGGSVLSYLRSGILMASGKLLRKPIQGSSSRQTIKVDIVPWPWLPRRLTNIRVAHIGLFCQTAVKQNEFATGLISVRR